MSIAHLDDHRPDAGGFEGTTPAALIAWAHAHPAAPGDESWHAPAASGCDDGSHEDTDDVEVLEWFGIPEISWDAPAAFAAANNMTTTAGKALLRDALVLRHRLPRVFSRVVNNQVPVWRARRIAQAVIGKPADVAIYVDIELAKIAPPGRRGHRGPGPRPSDDPALPRAT